MRSHFLPWLKFSWSFITTIKLLFLPTTSRSISFLSRFTNVVPCGRPRYFFLCEDITASSSSPCTGSPDMAWLLAVDSRGHFTHTWTIFQQLLLLFSGLFCGGSLPTDMCLTSLSLRLSRMASVTSPVLWSISRWGPL